MNPVPLTPLQIQATRLFFSLPAGAGFAVAGGAGLIARGLIARPTQDVDLFLLDARLSTVAAAASAFENAMDRHGWSHTRVLGQKEYIRQPPGMTPMTFSDEDPIHEPGIRLTRDQPCDGEELTCPRTPKTWCWSRDLSWKRSGRRTGAYGVRPGIERR
jgi:hypothetical protein